MTAFAEEEDWVMHEFGGVSLGDARRTKRLMKIVRDLSAQPSASFPEACGSRGALKACYRFFATPSVQGQALLEGHVEATRRRLAAEPVALVIQDTCELNYTSHPHTMGLGPLSRADQHGLFVHSSLAMSPDRVPLGLVDQQVWARDPLETGKAQTRKTRKIDEKESRKWLRGLEALNRTSRLCPSTRFILVADREADIYDLFAQERPPQVDLVIRAAHDRRVAHAEGYLFTHVLASKVVARFRLSLPRRGQQPARVALLALRFGAIRLCPPKHRAREALAALPLYFVHVLEETPPAGQAPVEWLLLTCLAVTTIQTARQVLDFYTCRWGIELWHKILKSGCRIEARQLAAGERLQRLLPLCGVIAWRVLWAVMLARHLPEAPASCLLEQDEWQALYCRIHEQPEPPHDPPALAQAVVWIAQLGGFIARKQDGHPGVTVLWRGFQHLNDLTAMFRILRPHPVELAPNKCG